MTRKRLGVLSSALGAIGVIALLASPADAMLLKGGVLGNGAMPAEGATGGGRILYGTVGQAAVGASGNSVWILCHGYWCFGGVRVISVDDPPEIVNLPTVLAFGLPMPNPASNPQRSRRASRAPSTVSRHWIAPRQSTASRACPPCRRPSRSCSAWPSSS